MIFYAAVLILVTTGLIYGIVSFIKERRNADSDTKINYGDLTRRFLMDIFAIVFCLKELFPDIPWL